MKCIECNKKAEINCCWRNTENGEPPYNWHPFCNKCAKELYEKESPKLTLPGFIWINKPL